MAEPFDVGKLIRGFNLFNGATFGKLLQQVIVIILVLAIAVGVWYKMFGQRTQVQQAEQITNIEQDKGFRILGFELFGWRN